MNRGDNLLQRYGGYLVLAAVAVMLFIWARTSSASAGLELKLNTEDTLPAAAAGDPQVATLPAAGPVAADEDALQASTLLNLDTLPIPADGSLSPDLNPFTFEGKRPELSFITYTVKAGDTPNGIAEAFGIKPETLLGGNPRLSEEASLLQTGYVLTILPVDGLLHDVRQGDTVENVAAQYSVSPEEIIGYAPNNLAFPYRLYAGTQILVPGAVREVFVWNPPAPPPRTSGGRGINAGIAPAVVGTGTFIWPVGGRRITQYFWYGHRGIDIALPAGSPVYASDTGTVIWADWNSTGYGNLIVLDHGNGFLTFYAHLSGYNVYPGQVVYQGNVIGAVGSTGRSSGPHLHFEVRRNGEQQDPFWPGYLP